MMNLAVLDKKKILLIIMLIGLIIYIDFTFLIKLQLQGIKAPASKIIKLKKDLDNLNKDLSAMQNLKQRQPTGEKQAIPVEPKEIISEEQVLSLLQDINNIANKYNIKIMQVKPSRELKAKESKAFGTLKLTPFIITLDLACDYHRLGSFINGLENDRVFMAVEELKITGSPDNPLQQKVSLALKTYVKK